MSIQKLVTLSILASLSFITMFFGIPIIPMAPYLNYEPSDVPLVLATVLFGPFAGLLALVVKILLVFLIKGGSPFGLFMNFGAAATYLITFSLLMKRIHWIYCGIVATLAMALVMIPLNMIIVPLEFGMPFEKVWQLLLPVYIPFNLIKGSANLILFLVLVKALQQHPYFHRNVLVKNSN